MLNVVLGFFDLMLKSKVDSINEILEIEGVFDVVLNLFEMNF